MCRYILAVVIQTRTCRDILRRLSRAMIIDFASNFCRSPRKLFRGRDF